MDDHFLSSLFPTGLKEDYNPNCCIHCGDVTTPAFTMSVMTANSKALSRSGNTTTYKYSDFIPCWLHGSSEDGIGWANA